MADCGMVSGRHKMFRRFSGGYFRHGGGQGSKKNNQYLSTPNFPGDSRGPDGYHFFAIYDPESQRLYVWHKDNF